MYVPNSSEYEGAREGDPESVGSTLLFRSPRSVDPGQTVTLVFRVYIPAAAGNYPIEASGRSGEQVIDSTENTNDDAPARTTIVQNGEQPAPPGARLLGKVLNDKGEGVPDVVVYLYRVSGTNAFDLAYAVNNEYGTLSAVTALDGTYLFRDIPQGVYRIEPDFTGLSFFPKEVIVETGFFAPQFTAVALDLNKGGCDTTRYAEAIVRSDDMAREGMFLGLRLAQFYSARASQMLKGEVRAQAMHELKRAYGQLQRSYTRVLNASELLPKLELQCSNKPGCREVSFKTPLQRYRAQLNIIRRLAFFVVRTSRQAGLPAGGTQWSRLASQIRKTHKTSMMAWSLLPRRTDICDSE
jgi:hypothetical protein